MGESEINVRRTSTKKMLKAAKLEEPSEKKSPKSGKAPKPSGVGTNLEQSETKIKKKKRKSVDAEPEVEESLDSAVMEVEKRPVKLSAKILRKTAKRKAIKLAAKAKRKEARAAELQEKKREQNRKKRKQKESKGTGSGTPLKKIQPIPRKVREQILRAYEEERNFIDGVFRQVPKKYEEKLDGYLIETTEEEEQKKREAYFTRTNTRSWADGEEAEKAAAPTREELRERLHAKIAEIAQGKRTKKKKRKAVDENGDAKTGKKSKKQFISKPNPNFVKGGGSSGTIGTETPALPKPEPGEKTPLRKKTVTKSDGQVVYSKFDFISEDKHYQKKGKPKPSELLRTVQKTESRISRLESTGKKSEAVTMAESKKWITALKRADGDKVRDDPALLKKTIKKQQKIKQTHQKQWAERTERVEKLKGIRTNKRLTNMAARKDEKKKRVQKIQRKRGRIL